MKKQKKIISILCIVVLLFNIAGCATTQKIHTEGKVKKNVLNINTVIEDAEKKKSQKFWAQTIGGLAGLIPSTIILIKMDSYNLDDPGVGYELGLATIFGIVGLWSGTAAGGELYERVVFGGEDNNE